MKNFCLLPFVSIYIKITILYTLKCLEYTIFVPFIRIVFILITSWFLTEIFLKMLLDEMSGAPGEGDGQLECVLAQLSTLTERIGTIIDSSSGRCIVDCDRYVGGVYF